MFSTLFTFCFIVVIGMVKESSSFCNPFDKDSGLAQKCGYSATVKFTHTQQYQDAITNVGAFSRLFQSCSQYVEVIVCSLNVPRCEANVPGPFLPCRRVCDEFLKQCSSIILKRGMEWIIGMCQLLPEKDDPNTNLGYLGRCFEPPNFKSTVSKSLPLKCNNLIVSACQNAGYTKTIMAEDRQKALSSWASQTLNVKSENPACDVSRKKLFCMENFIPCVDSKAASYCRSKCESFFEMNCTSPYKSTDYIMCMDFPTARNDAVGSDVCLYTDWPKAMNWPQVRNKQKVSSSTTRKPDGAGIRIPVTSSPVHSSSSPTSSFDENKTSKNLKDDNTDSNPKVEGASKPKMAAVVGGTMAVLIVIIIILVIVVFLYRRKQRTPRTSERDKAGADRTTKNLLDEQKI